MNQKQNKKMRKFAMNYYDSVISDREDRVTLKEFVVTMAIAIGFSIVFAWVFVYLIPSIGVMLMRA